MPHGDVLPPTTTNVVWEGSPKTICCCRHDDDHSTSIAVPRVVSVPFRTEAIRCSHKGWVGVTVEPTIVAAQGRTIGKLWKTAMTDPACCGCRHVATIWTVVAPDCRLDEYYCCFGCESCCRSVHAANTVLDHAC